MDDADHSCYRHDSEEATPADASLRAQPAARSEYRPSTCSNTHVNVDATDIARIRATYLKHAVLWVCELAARDRLEAQDLEEELRRYFESVVDSLPPDERRELSQQIDDICGRLGNFEIVSSAIRRN
jgi:hypothetical protein